MVNNKYIWIMRNKEIRILPYVIFALSFSIVLTSCRKEDDLTESIFDTSVPVVDPNKTTAEFDQWLFDNFVKPYQRT